MALRIYSKIKQSYRDGGITQIVKKSIRKASYLLYHANNAYWFRMDLQGEVKSFTSDGNVSVYFNTPHDTIEYIKKHGCYYPEEISTGLTMGHMYTNLKYRGKIIGYNKTGFNSIYIEDFKKQYLFPQNVAFTYDTYIDPEYRNRNYGAFLLNRVCNNLKQKGFKAIWAHIPPWNKASESMHRKLGFQRQKMIAYYWVAGIAWTTCNPVRFIARVENNQ